MASPNKTWRRILDALGGVAFMTGAACESPDYIVTGNSMRTHQESMASAGIRSVRPSFAGGARAEAGGASAEIASSAGSWGTMVGSRIANAAPDGRNGGTGGNNALQPEKNRTEATSSASPETSIAGGGGSVGKEALVRCSTDWDCLTANPLLICEDEHGRCVECDDKVAFCPSGQFCGTDGECHLGCANAADCATGVCDAARHRCVACHVDSECNAGMACDALLGVCVPGCSISRECPQGWACCNGACSNLELDEDNCGRCGVVCGSSDALTACIGATCSIMACRPSDADCNGNASDGCEANLFKDAMNCGACGQKCPQPGECREGVCSLRRCSERYVDCDADPANGCETDLDSDVRNCGACGGACNASHGVATCLGGSCSISCDPGWADCDADPDSGCEIDLTTDAENCGHCAASCLANRRAQKCAAGQCVLDCEIGRGDCDGLSATGCETALSTDLDNCGSCGFACELQHAMAKCIQGRCSVLTCAAGWRDCNDSPEDGCEVDILSDSTNCGDCGKDCIGRGGTAACKLGNCEMMRVP